MENYRFHEVLCPFCKKPFMTRIYDEYDIEVNDNGRVLKGWSDLCPKCDHWVFVVENDYEGKDLDSFEEESIREIITLR